jgi:hypothetical protein
MRIFLMILGAVLSLGALLFWLYLNALAASWNTSNSQPSTQWLTGEALLFFWLPFVLGLAIAFVGWKRR